MKKNFVAAVCGVILIIIAAAALPAQLAAPTAAGVSLGAVYYTVPDVTAHKKIWVDIFNAKPVMVGKTEMLKIPGAFIVLTQGQPAVFSQAPSEGMEPRSRPKASVGTRLLRLSPPLRTLQAALSSSFQPAPLASML